MSSLARNSAGPGDPPADWLPSLIRKQLIDTCGACRWSWSASTLECDRGPL